MPPASNMRKSSAATTMTADPFTSNAHTMNQQNSAPPRRTTGRAIRVSATRPANYYARPFAADHDAAMADGSNGQPQQPPGFFPALQFFSDAVTALPKEVMKQFTLMKEVEAKIHGPNEKLGELIDGLIELPVPARKQTANGIASASGVQGLLSFTANNSMSGSANPSVVNGAAGRHSAQPSVNGSVNGEEMQETDDDKARRRQYSDLRMVVHSMLGNLDEKNVVLSEANRVLALQESRIASVMPFIDEEISAEARLGSMTHWAYSDNRQKKQVTSAGAAKQRDVAATHSLADAANILHEREIAQARVAAGREATKDKGKGKRIEHAADSDFDEKPRKVAKVAKGKAAAVAAAATGLGIANGEAPTKRKKAEKTMGAPAMERTVSAGGRGAKGVRETPRSTPAAVVEPVGKKAAKAKPAPTQAKKKLANSAQNSPMLASSPLASSFNPLNMEPPPGARPGSSRVRQSSAATNLRHERLVDEESSASRPTSAAGKFNGNGEKTNGRRKVHETTEEHDEPTRPEQVERQIKEVSERLDREDIEMQGRGSEKRPAASRSNSDKGKNSGHGSKVGTPRLENANATSEGMFRSRSVRRPRGEGRDSSSSEPQMQGAGKHRRNASNSHLVKQLAPFNKSPNLDRHRDTDDSSNDEERAVDAEEPEEEEELSAAATMEREPRRSITRKPVSRGNTLRLSPAADSRESSPPASPPPTITTRNNRSGAVSGSSSNTNRENERERERELAKETFLRERHARNEREHALELERAAVVAAAAVPRPEHTEHYDDADDNVAVGDPGLIDDDEDSEHDPDDPDEPKYCYCNRGSYGEMVACDNDVCPREWFHLACTELREAPSEEDKWYCRDCRPQNVRSASGAGRGGRGKGSRRGARGL
ncbi:hypothetical protein TI39_contig323g00019 [Zymoseptoria brevis]|uniref:PHD-type domain-containing protein n=2 Tax=Zymoseptoria TaxID=1047167 RepID=A0A0F4GU14_9PEZI|nr:hypothetical protein TI39_contig323g00019 [Zymoseptoria brevis]